MATEEDESHRILALDPGRARVGVAVSDPLGWTAQPLEVIETRSMDQAVARIRKLARRYRAATLLVGLPVNMDGTEGEQAAWVRQFGGRLARSLPDAEIVYWDERLTTVASDAVLLESGMRGEKRKQHRDKIAAALILQSYLESRRLRTQE